MHEDLKHLQMYFQILRNVLDVSVANFLVPYENLNHESFSNHDK